ncbi:tetracycline resistance protein [Fusarium pseudocircinatum]|uniref:Tetracycline resistance protein n=1 Tax=Fusarium pseudocircinatum TaxID=56676 RepID=A0A8H5KYP4_9HYPO|nr:tetracycline resistance protein [Fusarium pseudocircinatum]
MPTIRSQSKFIMGFRAQLVKMAASSFPSFPRLPTELRLQIWIVACVSYQPDGHGIHYIDFEPTSTEATLSPSSTFTARLAEGDKDSACLRTGGLWMACKESRDVMIQYSKVDGHDCAWDTPHDHAEGWQIQLPDSSPIGSQPTNIHNIALEFNESWNKNLPKSYYDLMAESSARGFLSRLLYNRYLNDSTTPQIWIIVKNGQWIVEPRQQDTTKPWQNYDTDYVRMRPYFSCHHCRRTHDFDGVVRNVRSFTYDLNDLGLACEKDHRNYVPVYDDVEYGAFEEQFVISSGVRFLAHRDMQIDFCTGPGPDDDEREEEEDGRAHEEEDDSDLEY